MPFQNHFLPSGLLVNATAEWLLDHSKCDPSSAVSLDSFLVVVPTANAKRRLIAALTERCSAFLPPTILTPTLLLKQEPEVGDDDEEVALLARVAKAWQTREEVSFSQALARANDIIEIWRILEENNKRIADVIPLLSERSEVTQKRWRELLDFEAICPPPTHKKTIILGEVKTIVVPLPSILGAIPAFSARLEELAESMDVVFLQRPPTQNSRRLPSEAIISANDVQEEAFRAAELFAAYDSDVGIAMADEMRFPFLNVAFSERGIKLHTPRKNPLLNSSLGRIVEQLLSLHAYGDYASFAALIRQADVEVRLSKEFSAEYDQFIVETDKIQRRHICRTFKDLFAYARAQRSQFCTALEVIEKWRREEDLLVILRDIFSAREISADLSGDGDYELSKAAQAFCDELQKVNAVSELSAAERRTLFLARLSAISYSLDPEPDAVVTSGWLEVAWNSDGNLIVTGFNEGAVPAALVGHAWLPDSLRAELGVTTNQSRHDRDAALLREIVASRSCVHILLSRIGQGKDVCKPSRLLFEDISDAELLERVTQLYTDPSPPEHRLAEEAPTFPFEFPPAEPLLEVSASKIKDYLESPFVFWLKHVLKISDEDFSEALEINAPTFGNICHDVVEAISRASMRGEKNYIDLAETEIERAFAAENFPHPLSTVLRIQKQNIKKRVFDFIAWQMSCDLSSERKVFSVENNSVQTPPTITIEGVTFKGRIDRIDFDSFNKSWIIIDFKTWADRTAASYNAVSQTSGVWHDIQLPIYCRIFQAAQNLPNLDSISAAYLVLGKEKTEEVVVPAAEKDAQELICKVAKCLAKGIYLPFDDDGELLEIPALPAPYSKMFPRHIEDGIPAEWIEEQKLRIKELHAQSK